VIVIGSMVSLAYYLRVVAAVWMRPGSEPVLAAPVMAGGSSEAGPIATRVAGAQPEVIGVAILAAAAVVGFGIVPSPLLHLASDAAAAIFG